MVSNLVLTISLLQNAESLLFITSAVALIALIVDTLFIVKGSLPPNRAIDSWSEDSYPANWTEIRTKWFAVFQRRQIANVTGFASLLIGIVFG